MNALLHFRWSLFCCILMFTLFLWPTGTSSGPSLFSGLDKLVHCGIFFIFSTSIFHALISLNKRRVTKVKASFQVLLIGILFAFLTEGAQLYFTESRMADWWDIFADLTGTGMSIFAFLLLYENK